MNLNRHNPVVGKKSYCNLLAYGSNNSPRLQIPRLQLDYFAFGSKLSNIAKNKPGKEVGGAEKQAIGWLLYSSFQIKP